MNYYLKKKYIVHGVIRRSSSFNTSRIDHLYQDPHVNKRNFILHYGDVTDSISVSSLIKKVLPDEIYNLAAQSHVAVSFEVPEYTANCDALGSLRILEAIRFHKLNKKTKFYQAGTSLKCMEGYLRHHKMKKHHFIQGALMVLQKFMLTDNCKLQRSLQDICL